MKRSGMIRKIDNLGRIVIPMEIRKLLSISLKDEMEIFVGENNDVVVRKVNQSFDIEKYSRRICEMIYNEIKTSTFIVSRDKILDVFGDDNNLIDDSLTEEVKECINKKHYTSFNGGNGVKLSSNSSSYYAEIIMPIFKHTQPVGAIIIASKSDNFDISHLKYLRLAAKILEMTINEK